MKSEDNIAISTSSSIRDVQLEMLHLLKIVDRICRENNISFWLDGGTLLGAVRDKGFIPWDDDIDICLMKDDYDKLIFLLEKEIDLNKSSKIFLFFHGKKNVQYWCEYLCSKKFVVKKHGEATKPCRIDIFPMKSIESSDEENDRITTDVANYFIRGKIKYPEKFNKKYKEKTLKEGVIRKKEFMEYFNNEYMLSCNIKTPTSLVTYSFGDSMANGFRQYYTYSDIFPLKEIEFEGWKFCCPNNTDRYLSILYGDYMTPPPISQQKPMFNIFKHCNSSLSAIRETNKYMIEQNLIFFYREKASYKIKRAIILLRNKGMKSVFLAFKKEILHHPILRRFS
jgi:lipopolysaccharide cholinephosphotransferase